MKTSRILALMLFVFGCAPVHLDRPPLPQTSASPDEPDFADWPKAMEHPWSVKKPVGYLCDPAPKNGIVGGGPHDNMAIVVRTNPEALAAFKKGTAPMPVGTVVIKEKHSDPTGRSAPSAYGAMIKREPGYDPEHGDWEYLYVEYRPTKKV